MAGTINKVILIGHTGDEVKMHYFEGGNCIGRFPLATNEEYVNKNGDRISNTEWHNIVVRNKAAEICEKYLNKGDKIYIEGRIKTRKWQDSSGNDRYSTEIYCTDFTFLTPKNAGDSATQGENASDAEKKTESGPKNTAPPASSNETKEDILPF